MPEKILRKLPDPQPMPMTVTDALRSRRDDEGRKENRTFLPQPPERLGLSSREGRRLAL